MASPKSVAVSHMVIDLDQFVKMANAELLDARLGLAHPSGRTKIGLYTRIPVTGGMTDSASGRLSRRFCERIGEA
jgi:hypothetical protein